jgi:pimeloyl-ACP methyl ester carboxylesterase
MLTYEAVGDGVPVVLLHAFPLSHAMWRADAERFAQFGRVITPDLPGFGRSPRQSPPSIPTMASAVSELLDGLSVREPVVLAGLSMGGYVAFEVVRQFPKRVRALGLFSTRAVADTPDQRENRLKAAEQIRREGLGPLANAMLPKLLGRTTLSTHPSVAEAITEQILSNDPGGVADSLLAMAQRRDSTSLLSSIACPTLVVAGGEDAFIPATEAEGLQRQIPGAHLEVIARAGHLVNVEQPAAFQASVERFLQEQVLMVR